MREKVVKIIQDATSQLGRPADLHFDVTYPDPKFGDYATNVALVLSKQLKQKPQDVAKALIEKMDKSMFESVEVAGAGFINFKLKIELLIEGEGGREHQKGTHLKTSTAIPLRSSLRSSPSPKILLEYFQPNIAKPLHMGHLRTAIIGDAIKRMLLFTGQNVESDTHMGDWGTQFGFLILAQKKFGEVNDKVYAQLNAEAEKDESIRDAAKQEFVKLEQGDKENRKIWQALVDTSMKQFLKINDLMDILPFDHHWPESFYEDKMPAVLETLKKCKLLAQSQGAQIVNLEKLGLGIAVIVKSDGGTTYLLRDLATFVFAKQQGFAKHLYVVDNRQSYHYKQLFKILELMGEGGRGKGEGVHIDYGFISFKGEALSTRKGNMVLLEDVIKQAEEKVAKIIEQKNPDLKNKETVIDAVAKAALKYFDLKHNRHSDIEFDWDEVLDFEGDSGPYLQYTYARLASILRKAGSQGEGGRGKGDFTLHASRFTLSPTERELLFKLSVLPEVVEDALKDYLPNILANYLYNLAGLINRFYHESPVMQEKDENVRNFRLALIAKAKNTLGQGLDLLGIETLEEM